MHFEILASLQNKGKNNITTFSNDYKYMAYFIISYYVHYTW